MKKVYKKILILIASFIFISCGKTSELDFREFENMGQLSTVEYTITKLIIADDEAFYTIGDRKAIFSCKAILKAGVDMKNFSKNDVVIKDKEITVNLPEPTILSMNMPAEDIRCEYMKVGTFRSDFTAEERNKLLIQGEESILGDIESYGIIDKAKENVKIFFVSFLKNSGYETVNVVFIPNEKKEA